MTTKTDNQRFIAAIKYFYKHLDKPLTLEKIAQHVELSESSLKRLFVEITGQSAGTFIRKLRMELAFKRLHETDESILETALEVGFEDHAAFSRCFKKLFGFSPSIARKKLHIINDLESIELQEPAIVLLDDIQLQGTTAQGTYWEASPTAWFTLADILKQNKSENNDDLATFIGISHDNPHEENVAHDTVRFTAGIINSIHVYEQLIPMGIKGGRYAQFHFTGKLTNLGLPFHYIFGTWNRQNNNCIDTTKAPFMLFDRFPHKFEEHQLLICIPLHNN